MARVTNPDKPGPPRMDEALRERLRRLRASGLSFWRIARLLDAEGTPMVRGGRRWNHSTVRQAVQQPRRKFRDHRR